MALVRNTFASALESFLAGSAPLPLANGGTAATTADAARTSLVAAKSGANTDLTSLAGLTTALSVAQGGTGGTTAATAFNNIAVAAASLGSPGCLKFTNGFLIQWGTDTTGSNGESAALTFPVAFTTGAFGLQVTTISPQPSNLDGNSVTGRAISTTQFVLGCDDTARSVFWLAIGV